MDYLNLTTLGFTLGNIIPILLNNMNFHIGIKGVNYYSEVHTTNLNCIIHSIFMPFTIYGMFLWIPQVCIPYNIRNYVNINKFNYLLYITYMSHYIYINIYIGLLVSLYYSIPLYYSINKTSLKRGLLISSTALIIQEIFGHWISGDDPSRLEAIPNAIIYAPYFSISHFFY